MKFSASLVAAALFATASHADVPKVVADVAPVHSLVAQVMAGVGEPHFLIPARISPHGHSLKVSEARKLSEADLVFWIGETLTPWLEKALDTLAKDSTAVELLEIEGLTLLSDEDEEPEGEDDHGDEHHHGESDPHIWLDPQNAAVLIPAIAEALADADADNADAYRRNAALALKRLTALTAEVSADMAPFKGHRYVVYHDGYRYFEHRYGLGRAIAIANGHAVKPGARRLSEIRQILSQSPTRCVFAERQFGGRSVDAIIRGTDAQKAELDPMGESLTPGPELYSDLIRALSTSFQECLK